MRLYLIEMDNGQAYADYETHTQLIVATDVAQALDKARQLSEELFGYSNKPNVSVVEVVDVDGYGIEVVRR